MAGRPSLAYLGAQARVPLALAAAYDGRVLGALARAVSGAARVDERALAGVEATVYRPSRGNGPWPAVLVVPGVTRAGRRHPAFAGIGRGLAAVGQVAAVVEPYGLGSGELTLALADQVESAALELASEAREGRVALFGVSGGATIALLVAARRALARNVKSVAALAPCCDIPEAIRLVTTGSYRAAERFHAFETGDFFKLVIARSAVAWLPEGEDSARLRARLRALDDYGHDPLAAVREWPRGELGLEALSLVDLLANEDPAAFDELFAALTPRLRDAAYELSPQHVVAGIQAPVEVVVAREDKYIPFADAAAFAARAARARLTVLDALTHAVPPLSPSKARDLARLDAALVRVLAAAYSPA